MAFDNNHPNRKDWRKPYRRSGKHTRSCRPGGSCGWCRGNRTIGDQRLKQVVKENLGPSSSSG